MWVCECVPTCTCISYSLLLNKLVPNFMASNNKDLLSHSFCVSRIWSEVGWMVPAQGCSCHRSQNVGLELQSLKTCVGLEVLLPKWLTHVALSRKLQFFTTCATPLCCLNISMCQLTLPERLMRQKESGRDRQRHRERCNAFYDLFSEIATITLVTFY